MQACAAKLRELSKPFLNWSGKAEQHEIKVPTFELFKHEVLSADVILRTAKAQSTDDLMLELNLDDTDDIADRINAYEHTESWKNRLILGDSLQVMNSLAVHEGMAGKVQMVYFDPPYGVQYNSNFQPFVNKTTVKDGADADMIREPEMVRAFRDTWELGLHSYLTYIRDRALLARTMLKESGSIFVQISDTNVHHVRQVLDEVFGTENFVSMIKFQTTSGLGSKSISSMGDYLIWYAKDKAVAEPDFKNVYLHQPVRVGESTATHVFLPNGECRGVTSEEKATKSIPEGSRLCIIDNLQSQSRNPVEQPYEFNGKTYKNRPNSTWKAKYPEGMDRLAEAGRIYATEDHLYYIRFADDFPFHRLGNSWTDTGGSGFDEKNKKIYVVKTTTKVIERCMHMTTEVGDLVMDITCGSGTTPFVAEQWGRRWIAVDTSRVPIALARQRLLTSTFPCYKLDNPEQGISGGLVYKQKTDRNGIHIGGIVPHIKLGTISKNIKPETVRIMDRPEEEKGMVRVCGPFVIESTIQSAEDLETANIESADFHNTMFEVLRNARQMELVGGNSLTLDSIRELPDCDSIHAECVIETGGKAKAAIAFGPEEAYIGTTLLLDAHDEARMQGYDQLFLFGFGILPKTREKIDSMKIPTTYVDVKHDVVMTDLLKTDVTSQVFSITGMPDVTLKKAGVDDDGAQLYVTVVNGVDVFHPGSEDMEHTDGAELPCWMLDSNYEEHNAFCPTQVAFPATDAWEKMMKTLKATDDPEAWNHLCYLQGTESIPFTIGESGEVAVKVFNARGDELMKVCKAEDAIGENE